jgi:dsRNA-specific ribonuclease
MKKIRESTPTLDDITSYDSEPSSSDTGSTQPSLFEPSQYISVLQQYGSRHAFVPVYDHEPLAGSPLRFMAKLFCGNLEFEGVGRSKKEAKQKAAYEACNHFHLIR